MVQTIAETNYSSVLPQGMSLKWSDTVDATRIRRGRDTFRQSWYAAYRQYRFARRLGFEEARRENSAAFFCAEPLKLPRAAGFHFRAQLR